MTVRVITDTAATIPSEMASCLAISLVPLRLLIGDETFRDGEIEPEELLRCTEEATTAGPTPADFKAAMERHPDADGFVIATLAHDLGSSTYLAARAASMSAAAPTRVVDTRTAGGGQGLVVLEGAAAAASGGSLDDVEQAMHVAADRVRLVATLPNLDHLVRSGHVPQAAAWAARWIGLRPVIALRTGKVSPLAPAVTHSAGLRKVYETWRRSIPSEASRLHVAALHSMAPGDAEELLAMVSSDFEPSSSFVGSFGSPMILHVGPGVVGLSWWWATGADMAKR